MIFIAIVALWLLIWLVSALLASQTANKHGYDGGLFFRYGLLAGPWAYAAARNAPSYNVSLDDIDDTVLIEEDTVHEPIDADATDSNIADANTQADDPFVDETPELDEEPESDYVDYVEESEEPTVLEAVEEDHLELPDPDPEHVAEMDGVLAAEAAAIEAMLRGEDPDEARAAAELAATVEEEPEDGWGTRDGGRAEKIDISDLGVERPARNRERFKPKTIEEPVEIEEEPEDTGKSGKKSGGLFGRGGKKNTKDIPVTEIVTPVLPITDAIEPVDPTAATCASCKKESYSTIHGLCARCAEVWQPVGKKR